MHLKASINPEFISITLHGDSSAIGIDELICQVFRVKPIIRAIKECVDKYNIAPFDRHNGCFEDIIADSDGIVNFEFFIAPVKFFTGIEQNAAKAIIEASGIDHNCR